MSASFAQAAGRLAGFAIRAFGWSPDQFWQATPAELATALAVDDAAGPATLSRAELHALIERENHD